MKPTHREGAIIMLKTVEMSMTNTAAVTTANITGKMTGIITSMSITNGNIMAMDIINHTGTLRIAMLNITTTHL